jgi:hypothetical protein
VPVAHDITRHYQSGPILATADGSGPPSIQGLSIFDVRELGIVEAREDCGLCDCPTNINCDGDCCTSGMRDLKWPCECGPNNLAVRPRCPTTNPIGNTPVICLAGAPTTRDRDASAVCCRCDIHSRMSIRPEERSSCIHAANRDRGCSDEEMG